MTGNQNHPQNPRRRTTSSKRKKSAIIRRNRIIAIIAVSAAIAAVLVAIVTGWFYITFRQENGTILDNVTIAGVNVGGLTKKDAISAVSLATQHTYNEKDMSVTVLDHKITISPDESKARLDVAAAVEAAYAYGRTGSASQQANDKNQALANGYALDLTPYLNLDTNAIQEALEELGEAYNSTLSQSSVDVIGEIPSLVPGEAADTDCQVLQVTIGTPEYGLDMVALYDAVIKAYNSNTFQVEQGCTQIFPNALDLTELHQTLTSPAQDAVMDMKTFEVTEGQCGYTFDLDAAHAAIKDADYGATLEIPCYLIMPEVLGDSLSSLLYADVLATYTADNYSDENRNVNLSLACKAIDGVILEPGDTFSYNGTLGERTEENGYKPGASYAGDDTVTTIGGGICQVSSALYYCAMVADLEIVERDYHGFATTYMPLGMDSTINWGTIDLKFRNNGTYPIRIEANSDGGSVTVRLIGTDTKDYVVKMEYEILRTYAYGTSYQVLPADNPEGYLDGDVLVSPYTGYDVKTYRCRYDKETNELLSRDFEAASYYRKRDEVICKIAEEPTETEPEETTPEESAPIDDPTEPAEPTDPDDDSGGLSGTVSEDEGGQLP